MRKFKECTTCTDYKTQFFNCEDCKVANEKDKRVSKKSN